MTVLVTGAAGFLGNQTIKQLVALSRPVRAMVRHRAKARIRLGDVAEHIEIVEGDVTDPDSLAYAMRDISAVIHTVAIAMEKGGQTYEEVNFQGTVNVLNAAEAAGVMRFINMSQNGARGDLPYRFPRQQRTCARICGGIGDALDSVAPLRHIWSPRRILQHLCPLAQADSDRFPLDRRRQSEIPAGLCI